MILPETGPTAAPRVPVSGGFGQHVEILRQALDGIGKVLFGGQGNFRFTGWLETARVRVDAIAGATWTLAVLERKGSIQVDGRPIEPLKVAVPVRLKLDPG